MSDQAVVEVPVDELTIGQLVRATYDLLTRIETRMSELDDAVAALTQAVTDIANRILPRITDLENQLAAAQAGEAGALADAAENVTAIRADVDALNALATDTPPDTGESGTGSGTGSEEPPA
jgi:phage shock protein A